MNFFKIKTSWSNAELIVLKLCVASAYIAISEYFHTFFQEHIVVVLAVLGITCVWSVYLWGSKMNHTR